MSSFAFVTINILEEEI